MKKKTSQFEIMLSALDDPERRLNQFEILGELEKIKQVSLSPEEIEKLEFEFFAFRFKEHYDWSSWDKKLAWDTYYGPLVAGKISQEPSGIFLRTNDPVEEWTIFSHRDKITEPMLDYWKVRMNTAKNPILKTRYAGLLWEFYTYIKKNEKSSIPLEAARIFIDTINSMGNNKNYLHEIIEREEVFRLQEAFKVAVYIKDKERIAIMSNTIINYEKNITFQNILAIAISYDLFLSNKKYSKYISENDAIGIVIRMENNLDKMIAFLPKKYCGLSMINELVIRLLSYYKNETKILIRVIEKYVAALEQQENHSTPMRIQFWLAKAYSIIPASKDMKKYRDEITIKLQKIGLDVQKNMERFEIKTNVSQAEMESFLSEMTQDSFEENMQHFTFFFLQIFSKKTIEENIEKNKGAVQHIPVVYTGKDGRIIANGGALIPEAARQIVFCAPWMQMTLDKIFEKNDISVDKLVEYLYRSPIFQLEKSPFIKTALKAYINQDAIVFLHTIIPQFEVIIRYLLKDSPLLKKNRFDGFDLLQLGAMLSDDNLKIMLGEDIIFYFKVLFTEQTGLNLRNDICHGLADINQFTMATASLVLHAFLILSEIRLNQP